MIYSFLFFQKNPVFAPFFTYSGEQLVSKSEKSKVLTRNGLTN
jgi:hypothetical protein